MPDPSPLLRDRIAGALYGQLVGDALGCPVEGWAPAAIAATYGRLANMEVATERWRPAGLHSDDGQQALALCDALLVSPEAPEHTLAATFVELFVGAPKRRDCFGLHRGTGKGFRAAVRALVAGAAPHDAGQRSSSNGVAMMIGPAACRWYDDLDRLREVVIRVGRVKQRAEPGIAGAAAVAFVAAHGIRRGGFGAMDDGELLEFTRSVEAGAAEAMEVPAVRTFSSALARMLERRCEPAERVFDEIAEEACRTAERRVYAGSGYAPASVVTAIFLTLTGASYEAAVTDAVNLGGDTDTTGAIVGAMMGAAGGRSCIPGRWYEALVARDALETRIDALVDRRRGWAPERSLRELELEWSRLLDERPKR